MKKCMQIRLAMITLTFILAVILSGAVSAATYNTDTSLSLSTSTAYVGQSVTLTAHLTYYHYGSHNLAGQTIHFIVDGVEVGTGTTNSNGYATYTYTPGSSGTDHVQASFSGATFGGNTYRSSSDFANLNVADTYNTDTSVSLSTSSAYVGDHVTLTARLTRQGTNNPIPNQLIHFTVNGAEVGTGYTNYQGYATCTYTPGSSGLKNVQASYNGGWRYSDYYKSSSSNVQTLNVGNSYNTHTTLSFNHDPAVPGNQIICTAHVTYQVSGPDPAVPDGLIVTFTADGNPIGSGITNNGYATCTYTAGSDANIQANFATQYSDGNRYSASHDDASLDVHSTTTTLTINPNPTNVGNSVTLSSHLTRTSTGSNLGNRIIHFIVNGVDVGTGTTNDYGWAYYTYTPLNSGNEIIQALFYGSLDNSRGYDYDYDYYKSSSSTTETLTVNANSTNLAVDPASGYKGDSTTLRATLTSAGNPLSGKNIKFYINGVEQGSNTTDANGVATWAYNITQNVGNYPNYITALFEGDSQYLTSTGANTLTVNAIPTSLKVDNVTGNKGHCVDLKATLWDTFHDKAISGKTVDFYINDVKVGSATTDANGVATFSYCIDLVGGTYDIDAEFAADTPDDQYASSEGEGTLKVPQSNVYVITTVNKNNPTIGETITITFKLGNKGPDGAEQVIFTFVIPDGLQFVDVSGDGNYSYDAVTRTITWNLGDVPANTDPYLYLLVKPLHSGSFNINPEVSLLTYDPDLSSNIQFATVNAVKPKVNAASKTIPLQHTGLPLAGLVLAVLAIFGGLVMPRKKN